jgi:hypothetical protein
MKLATTDIISACQNPKLWGAWFKHPSTWAPWFAFLKSFFGLEMSPAELEIFEQCTGRKAPPAGGFNESWLICGRRAGKSFILALSAVYLAVFRSWVQYLVPGERGLVMVIANDRKQARVIFHYARALLANVPSLAVLVQRETDEEIVLTNGISIEITTSSFRTVRGYTVVAALLDEAAFFRSEDSANPDREILDALRPAMATIPGAVLFVASSPYSRKGIVFDAHKRYYGKDGSVLVWQADTRTMNPSVPQSFIDDQYARDPASAAAEYGAQFRSDVEALLTLEVVEAVTIHGRYELPRMSGTSYLAFVDPSGGSADSMTLAIAHRDKDGRAVLDAVRERKPPFSPESVVAEFSELLKSYGVHRVTGDRYAGEWPRERFRVHGITYIPAEASKSDFYRDCLPLFNSGKIELLDLPRLSTQFVGLERRTARSGKDSIDHAPGAHDDIANAAAGALVLVGAKAPMVISDAVLARFTKPVVQVDPWYRRAPSNGSPALVTGSRRGVSRR